MKENNPLGMVVPPVQSRDRIIKQASFLTSRFRFAEALELYKEALLIFPNDGDLWNCKGVCYKNLGKPLDAFECYEIALKHDPRNASAANNKGVIYKERDDYEQALLCYQQALELDPNHRTAITNMAVAYTDMGTRLKTCGKVDEALKMYGKAVRRDPNYAPCLYNIGVLQSELGNVDLALESYQSAVRVNPRYVEAYNNMGAIYKNKAMIAGETKRYLEEAIKMYETALAVNPNFEMAKGNLAVAMTDYATQIKTTGDLKLGIKTYKNALVSNPYYPDAYYNLGVAYGELFQFDKALVNYKLAIKFNPKCAEAYNNLGVIYKEKDNLDEAINYYTKALEANPRFSQSLNNIGVIYTVVGRMSEAYEKTMKAIEVNPEYSEAYNNLGVLYRDQGDVVLAVEAYEKCISIDPNSRNALQNRLLALNYLDHERVDYIYNESIEWSLHYMKNRVPYHQWNTQPKHRTRKIRLGYIGPDFFTHSVSYFIHAPLRYRDRNKYYVIVYSNVLKEDDKTRLFKTYVDEWKVINHMKDIDVAKIIYDDQIDILFELTGHTANNRLDVVSLRPAPIQITWIGYPNTTGLGNSIRYRISDHFADPVDTKQPYAENLIRMPHSFLCYTPTSDMPADCGLPPSLDNGYITFGSFNTMAKLGPQVISLWAQILRAVPRSHLLIKAKPLVNEDVAKRFIQLFEKEGIEKNRIDVMGLIPHCTDHLTTYYSLDIALDPFPYAGTTTSCEALLMGVPLITLKAPDNHAHNVGVSLLSSVGFTELITNSRADYLKLAVKLANDPQRLTVYRKTIRPRMLSSPLCNGPLFMQNFEVQLEKLYTDFHEGRLSTDFIDVINTSNSAGRSIHTPYKNSIKSISSNRRDNIF